jgi:hypothetical protein
MLARLDARAACRVKAPASMLCRCQSRTNSLLPLPSPPLPGPPCPALTPGGFSITRPRITLRSATDQWAVISLPTSDPQNAVNVITLRPGADYGVLSVGAGAGREADYGVLSVGAGGGPPWA